MHSIAGYYNSNDYHRWTRGLQERYLDTCWTCFDTYDDTTPSTLGSQTTKKRCFIDLFIEMQKSYFIIYLAQNYD